MLSASLLTGTLGLGGFQAAGYGSNHQDLSPKYSGILFGLTNASASSAGALAVFATGSAPSIISTQYTVTLVYNHTTYNHNRAMTTLLLGTDTFALKTSWL